jgi:hypothetical protein
MQNNALDPLPINQFAFEKIRSQKMIYVDKTQLIYKMVSHPDYHWSQKTDMRPQTIKQQLKERYNGFRFSISDTYVYNPISVLNALKNQSFGSYSPSRKS